MKIKKQDKLTLLSALLVGVIAGSYLYIIGFAPEFENKIVPIIEDETKSALTYTITADMYGGMRAGIPPSFEVKSTGQYHYLPFVASGTDAPKAQTGTLPADLHAALTKALTDETLVDLAKPVTKDMCALMVDGIDYKYTINLDDAVYILDTCTTALEADSEFGLLLQAVWEYMGSAVTTAV